MAGFEHVDFSVRMVALERLRAGRQEERIVLAHTARSGGYRVRTYSWNLG